MRIRVGCPGTNGNGDLRTNVIGSYRHVRNILVVEHALQLQNPFARHNDLLRVLGFGGQRSVAQRQTVAVGCGRAVCALRHVLSTP